MAQRRWFMLLLCAMLAGCRSEKAAFQFRPSQPLLGAMRAENVAPPAASASYTTVPGGSSTRPARALAGASWHITQKSQPHYRHAGQITHPSGQRAARSGNTSISEKPAASGQQLLIRRQPVGGANDALFFSGAALLILGLILGIAIGGSSGLLLALLLIGIGYLLASKGYGSHP